MSESVIDSIVIAAPNFAGLAYALWVQARVITRLIDKLDTCDCEAVHPDDDETETPTAF